VGVDVTTKTLLGAGALGLGALALLRARRGGSFKGKVVLLTGGSRGLGLLLAREFAREGARLALLARSAGALGRAAAELRGRWGAEVLELPADVGDRTAVERALAATVAYFGQLDVLVNNAGIIQVGPYAHMDTADFEAAMRTHFWGPLYATLAALPHLKGRGGRIVNIASIGGKVAVPHLAPYSASKFALVGLSDALRAELAREGVRVTTVCPWLTRTGSYRNVSVKGQHALELAWFALSDSLPLISMSGEAAAKQIVAAARRGAPRLVLTPYGKAAVAAEALRPGFVAAAMAAANRLLPGPTLGGDEARVAHDVTSPVAPSLLTLLADRAAARNNEL
jgi:short-subunit dehydrogenase